MRRAGRFTLIVVVGALAAGCATTAKFPLARAEAFHFSSGAKAPVVCVVSPVVQVNASYGVTDRARLDPHIKQAQNALADDFVSELQRKGYQAFGKQVVFEGLPKDAQDRRLRWVVSDANTEFDVMGRVLFMNAVKEHNQPLEYQLGRLSVEIANLVEPTPDWLMLVQTAAYVYGVLPLSEVETPTAAQKMGTLLGIGIASPGYDYIAHVVGMVDAANGQLLWFNSYGQGSKSIIFPADRAASVKATLSKLPAYETGEGGIGEPRASP